MRLDDQGQPYAEAVKGPEPTIAISHELLEMLADGSDSLGIGQYLAWFWRLVF